MNPIQETFSVVQKQVEYFDIYLKFISLSVAIHQDDKYKNDPQISLNIPWQVQFYKEVSDNKLFNLSDIPNSISVNKLSSCFGNYLKMIKYKKYASRVFFHIRSSDNQDNILNSLNPDMNIMQEDKVDGGRSGSEIIFTYDKKYLLKRIPKTERETLLKILGDYHNIMINSQSLLCRIYGLYTFAINDFEEDIILMRNMNELSSDVFISLYRLNYLHLI